LFSRLVVQIYSAVVPFSPHPKTLAKNFFTAQIATRFSMTTFWEELILSNKIGRFRTFPCSKIPLGIAAA